MSVLNECFEWKGARDSRGYGQKTIKYRRYFTHRLAYAWANGPIPAGMHVLHRCDNPPCCNPSHLFLGTAKDNQADKSSKGRHHHQRKTHCPSGHPYSGDNLKVRADGSRICRECHRLEGKKRFRNNRDAINAQHRAYYHRRKR